MKIRIDFKISIIILLFFILSNACSNDSADATGNNATSSDPVYTNPIMQNDNFFTGSHWNDPHVLYINNTFVMYASSDVSFDGYVKIYRLASTDGVNWNLNPSTPVLDKSVSGWDSHCVETPAVVYFNNQYHMFYTGYDVAHDYSDPKTADPYDDDNASKHFQIGHAVSNDGISFTKTGSILQPSAPYVAPNLAFNQYVVGEPAPVVFNNKIYLYFTAVGAAAEVGTTWQTIGLMTSSDGTTWDAPRRVLTPDLSIYPRTTGDEYLGYSTPNAIVINNQMHLYYDVVLNLPWTQVMLHHAVSTDGETSWTQDVTHLLSRSSFDWTADEIRSPSALAFNNRLYLYFAGHKLQPAPVVANLAIGLKIYALP